MMRWRRKKKYNARELEPDEILLDAYNLPKFNQEQFEGRVERPIGKNTFRALGGALFLVMVLFVGRLLYLQAIHGATFALRSDQNSLNHVPVFADRGIIYDRKGVELAWNATSSESGIPGRLYAKDGFAALVGYVSYPNKDAQGRFWQEYTEGRDGVEEEFQTLLSGVNGRMLIETDVHGAVISENTIDHPINGHNVELSIDAGIQSALYGGIVALAEQSGYRGGTAAIMDIETGELLAATSYPEYDSAVISDGINQEAISGYLKSKTKPFLNRLIEGLYTPGSIVKPFLALGALEEGVITPEKTILSTGEISIPNPYNPNLKSVFKDNKAHGLVDMRRALAVSSNVYFYQIGGGYGSQRGIGIAGIERSLQLFGISEPTGINLSGEKAGNIPSIAWKHARFPNDPWRVGDTYNTAIGQYGFQVTPIQMLRAIAGVASRGVLVSPSIVPVDSEQVKRTKTSIPIREEFYQVVHEGMRMAVTEGTATALNLKGLSIAAKTGTAQINQNTRVNSWVIGFFPYERPRYAFVALMEDGPLVSSGAAHAIKPAIVYLLEDRPELLGE